MPYILYDEGYELEKKDTPGQVVDLCGTLKQQNTLDFVLVGMHLLHRNVAHMYMYMYMYLLNATYMYIYMYCLRHLDVDVCDLIGSTCTSFIVL